MDVKILDFIEGMYSRKLADKEVIVLKDILNGETIESFKKKYQFALTKKVSYFTPQRMQELINEENEIQVWMRSAGIQSLDELYDN